MTVLRIVIRYSRLGEDARQHVPVIVMFWLGGPKHSSQ
jgi:hypothetical protein